MFHKHLVIWLKVKNLTFYKLTFLKAWHSDMKQMFVVLLFFFLKNVPKSLLEESGIFNILYKWYSSLKKNTPCLYRFAYSTNTFIRFYFRQYSMLCSLVCAHDNGPQKYLNQRLLLEFY